MSIAFNVDLSTGVMTWGDNVSNYAFVYEMENILAGSGFDTIVGTDFSNEIFGGGCDDHIEGRGGHDYLYCELGDDTILGGSGRDQINGGRANDNLSGGGQNDRIFGSDGNDEIRGGAGDDWLSDGNGHDKLKGGKGQDLLIGDKGDDILTGGADSDTVRFAEMHGHDMIVDFDTADALELIDFTKISAISDLTSVSVDTTDGLLITTGASSSLVLSGVDLASLDSGDFDFV